MFSIDFASILLLLTVFTAAGTFFYRWCKGKSNTQTKVPLWVDYCRSFFPAFLIVLIIRSFIAQIYNVPSGSLEPTILPGEFILATQYDYGLHLPGWNKTILSTGLPKRGSIVLFHDPVNPQVLLIKRLIGMPGDIISYRDKVLYINGKKITQTFVKNAIDEEQSDNVSIKEYKEDLLGLTHNILINPNRNDIDFYQLKVPQDDYFMMGDNRDNSNDGRYFGFVNKKELVGQAVMVLFSWDHQAHGFKKIRFNRIGTILRR